MSVKQEIIHMDLPFDSARPVLNISSLRSMGLVVLLLVVVYWSC